MRNELSGKLDSVRELLESKKGDKEDEVTKMRLEIENLRKTLREGKGASSSESVFDRYKRELEEERVKSDRQLAVMEDEIARLRVVNDEAVAAADVWKQEALRPDNKRGSVVVTTTPVPGTRTRARMTLMPSPSAKDLKLKEKVEHQEREIESLKEWRLRELNGRREAELEVDHLKEKMARLEVVRRTPTTSNLKTRLDKVVVAIADKEKRPMSPTTQVVEANDRDAFLFETRRTLKPLKKEKIVALCEKEGVTYSTLDKTKGELALKRADIAFDKDRGGTLK
ncbi:hypothetical protein CBR_g23163 [Chara braunii]|uniref:Uncharacterized protein n=1 Tax=Chara braunii TaxID=69332 RepID=A0A388L3R0_CHABU|nr:hypothetical protein CBR_g23163 [Chara braunii]|eukprot:GBG76949.1 hypothetical protein CBR_g23163 [Chara braunii]